MGGTVLTDSRLRLEDLPTPCLVLDRATLMRNLTRMARAASRHGVALRPHMKTAKSVEVARLALAGQPGGITVSTLAEAEYFVGHGLLDQIYAVAVTPQKLAEVAKLNAAGGDIAVITDDPAMAAAIAATTVPVRTLIEIDTGEARGGLRPDSPELPLLAAALGSRLAGVLTHAGHSYACRSEADLVAVAQAEHAGIVQAATRLREAGHAVHIVSMGSTPTAMHADRLDGVTELRAGVYMFGDLFQMQVGRQGLDVDRADRAGQRHRPAPGRAAAADRCGRAGAVQGPQLGGRADRLRLRPGAGPRGHARDGRRGGQPRLPGARDGGAGPVAARPGPGGGRQAARGAQPRVHDRGRA